MLEWMEALKKAIRYIEDQMFHNFTIEDVAKHVNISPFYFQKAFKIMTGYSVGEYVRKRRLYLAAIDAVKGEDKIIELAYKYGYDTPESFTKAFSRFHGISPLQIKGQPKKIKTFQPLQISISIKGGSQLDYRLEKMEEFWVVGIEKIFSYERAFEQIPVYWAQYCSKYQREYDKEMKNACIGMYGISIAEDRVGTDFRYLIAGNDCVDQIPEGLIRVKIPALTWAKFRCVGSMPEALQAVNTKIYNEWMVGNSEYEIAAGYNIEWYSNGDIKNRDYVCEIWIPVTKK
ncbi:MAG: effector binding domain-containing protein [Velocimicrobium sp.]